MDLSPGYPNGIGRRGTYRDFAYVESEVASLAQQLSRL
jgi:hypothetical protein